MTFMKMGQILDLFKIDDKIWITILLIIQLISFNHNCVVYRHTETLTCTDSMALYPLIKN